MTADIVELIAGERVLIRDSFDDEIANSILQHDEYELDPIKASGAQVSWVVDCGAHIGLFARKVKRLWPTASVIALEPGPDNARLFRKNLRELNSVFFFEAAAVGIRPERVLSLRAPDDGNRAACYIEEIAENSSTNSQNWIVLGVLLVELLESFGNPTIEILKLDCEGAEAEILESLSDEGYLERVGWIRGEWHGVESIGRIEQALMGTHTYHIHRGAYPWGGFIAHRT